MKKKTIARTVELEGVGIHSGRIIRLSLNPSESGRIEFRLGDKGGRQIALDPRKTEADNCMALTDGRVKIRTVEHLMAVLFVFGLDSLLVELSGEEIPILDGSALPFAEAVQKAGQFELPQKKNRIKITKPFRIRMEAGSVEVVPDPELRISYRIEYDHPSIGEQVISLVIDKDTFVREIAPARTFGFLDEVPALKARGLAHGGSFDNAVVLDKKGVISGPLRFPDEFVRHKVLDFVGDLGLLGASLEGHFKADLAGHRLHRACVLFLMGHRDHWSAR